MSAAKTEKKVLTKEEKQKKFQQEYNDFKDIIAQLTEKVNQLRADYDEHMIVLDTIKKAPVDRKCYRMVGGVLVESTAKETKDVLEVKTENILKALDTLSKELVKTHGDFDKWKTESGVKIVRTD